MNFQVTIEKMKNGKILAMWQTRKDTESVEKYDNELSDGFHYVGVNGPASNEAEIVELIKMYCELRIQKASNDVLLPQRSKIEWHLEKARKQFVK